MTRELQKRRKDKNSFISFLNNFQNFYDNYMCGLHSLHLILDNKLIDSIVKTFQILQSLKTSND